MSTIASIHRCPSALRSTPPAPWSAPYRPGEKLILVTIVAISVALATWAALTFTPFARGDRWRATVTPLASIIGSGFLISGPLLAAEFGRLAIVAMALLLALAYAIGWVVRLNIAHAEPYLAEAREAGRTADPVRWTARVTQSVLALAYAVSVAYYLKLLAEFALKPLSVPAAQAPLLANIAVTVLIVAIAVIARIGGPRRVEHVAELSVSAKIGIIAGLVAGLAVWWIVTPGASEPLPPARLSAASIPLLLGLVITVQGFETSRYLGELYPAKLRISTMRQAQLIAAAIYLVFLALLTPRLASAARVHDVAGIVDVLTPMAAVMGVFILIGAIASQLSAAVADAIGSSGLIAEVSQGRASMTLGFAATSALAVLVVWLTDPFQVVAVASRAFAVFYALQCAIAVMVARRRGVGGRGRIAGFVALGLVCLVAAATGAPAEH